MSSRSPPASRRSRATSRPSARRSLPPASPRRGRRSGSPSPSPERRERDLTEPELGGLELPGGDPLPSAAGHQVGHQQQARRSSPAAFRNREHGRGLHLHD